MSKLKTMLLYVAIGLLIFSFMSTLSIGLYLDIGYKMFTVNSYIAMLSLLFLFAFLFTPTPNPPDSQNQARDTNKQTPKPNFTRCFIKGWLRHFTCIQQYRNIVHFIISCQHIKNQSDKANNSSHFPFHVKRIIGRS
jgi:hypothetical protein